jgi:hypothetical protein
MTRAVRVAPRLLLGALVVISLSGCWPLMENQRTAVTGTVVSGVDGKPVAGATVTLSVPREDLAPQTPVQTSSDGSFSAPPYYRLGYASVVEESWEVPGTLLIVAPGYAAYRQELHWKQNSHKVQKMGVIRLKPMAQ